MRLPMRWDRGISLLAVLALSLACFWPGLSGHFVFDDFPNIVQNPAVHATRIDSSALMRAAQAFEPGPFGRPLPMMSFAVDHALYGLDARGWKRTNLVIHLANTALVFALLLSLLRWTGRELGGAQVTATVVAALWAIHPLQVSTVLYVVQRMEMMAATSLLLALLAYLAGRRRQLEGRRGGWALIMSSGLIAATGLISKESAVIFPLLTLTLEVTLLRFQSARAADSSLLRWGYAIGSAIGAALFLAIVIPHYAEPAQYAYRDFTMEQRLLSQLTIVPTYLQQILVPKLGNMLFNYDHLSAPSGLLDPPTVALGGLLLGALGITAIALRARVPLFAAGILWFFAAHALTSNVAPLELAYEHRNYLALLGVLIAGFGLGEHLLPPKALKAVALASLLLLAFLGFMRSLAWSSALSLAVENATNNPLSARAANDLGVELAELSGFDPKSPYFARAVAEFERGMMLPRSSPLPEQALIILHTANNLPVDARWWDSIDRKLRTQAIGVQERLALSGLLDQASEGFAIDPERLERSWRLVDERFRWPAHQRALFADWLSKQPGREAQARIDLTHASIEASQAGDARLESTIRERIEALDAGLK